MLSRLKSGQNLKNSGVTFGTFADRLLEIKSATLAPSSIKRDRILLQKPKKLLNMDIRRYLRSVMGILNHILMN